MSKTSLGNSGELYFKMIKSDTKLIKSTLERNNFKMNESGNNFSVCWLGNINNIANKY